MGSWFSSPAAVDPAIGFRARNRQAKRDRDDYHGRLYALFALHYYNKRNPDAKFDPFVTPLEEPKVACVGFRQDFWYHVGFWAGRTEDAPVEQQQYFFAEIRFERRSRRRLIIETCLLLEKPICRFKTKCAFCPEKFQILHPAGTEFTCGKKRHKKKFFRERQMRGTPFKLRY